eukprot:TRINITY_DN1955_c0_g1_i2.p1 TRINITY_DN1955_c0_g1~~TRINITY_DN1955_c0_g1_i2.p1  ORF type:complete len:396 (+),score=115.61 TRINITY_DN1955_c0_g1_i2:97-1284(+)
MTDTIPPYSQEVINTLTLASMRNVKQLVSYVNDAKYSFITSVQQKMVEYSNLSKIVLKSIKIVLDTVVKELTKLEAKQPLPPDYAMVQLVKRHCLKLRDQVVTIIRCSKIELNNVIQEYDLVFQMQTCISTAKNILAAAEKLENFRSVFQIDEVLQSKEEPVEEEVHDRIRAYYDEDIDEESYSESLEEIESYGGQKKEEHTFHQLEPIKESPIEEDEDNLVDYLTGILTNTAPDTPQVHQDTQKTKNPSNVEENPPTMSIKEKIASLELQLQEEQLNPPIALKKEIDEDKIVITRPKEEPVAELTSGEQSEQNESTDNNSLHSEMTSEESSDVNFKKKWRKSKEKWRKSVGETGNKLNKIMGKRHSDILSKKTEKSSGNITFYCFSQSHKVRGW